MRASEKASQRPNLEHILFSSLGGFAGILAIERMGFALGITGIDNLFLIGSFGASAVLVYGVPQAEFSQPRNLVGGHFVSALVGVTTFQFLGSDSFWACPVAVAFAIFAMQITRTVHPPGGATALIAVAGGEKITSLGFLYVFCPVLTGTIILVMVALLVNNVSYNQSRSYPHYWW